MIDWLRGDVGVMHKRISEATGIPLGTTSSVCKQYPIMEFKMSEEQLDSIIKALIFNERDNAYYNDVQVPAVCSLIKNKIDQLRKERKNNETKN